MAVSNQAERSISEATLDGIVVSKIEFSGVENVDTSKGRLSIALTPTLSTDYDNSKLILDLNLLANGELENDEPAFTLEMSFRSLFSVSEETELSILHDAKENHSFIVKAFCKQIYPVVRNRAQDILDSSAFRGVTIPWITDFEFNEPN